MINDQYAVYLPAVQDNFASCVTATVPVGRPFPSGIDLSDLAFWNKNSKLWTHNKALYSIGQHSVGSTVNNGITSKGRTDFLLVGDSGGYQIGKGSLSGFDKLVDGMSALEALDAWACAYEVKDWITGWLETHCDYAMTLDMPLWATLKNNENSPFHKCSPEMLMAMTKDNLKFIDKHRQGRTKWLNVIQGLDEQSTITWWNTVKWFDCSGYAIAGAAGIQGGIKQLLTTILMMRDDKAFKAGHDWIHVLGVSTTRWSILLSAIQRQLQKHVNPKLRVSFDSSSPFRTAGISQQLTTLPTFNEHTSSWSFGTQTVPQGQQYIGNTTLLSNDSPIGRRITLGDLNVVADEWQSNKFDTISNMVVTNHNVYIYLKGFEEANRIAFETDRNKVPTSWRECIELIERVFDSKNWRAELENGKPVLDAVAPPA